LLTAFTNLRRLRKQYALSHHRAPEQRTSEAAPTLGLALTSVKYHNCPRVYTLIATVSE
jgi:hypothetical protein